MQTYKIDSDIPMYAIPKVCSKFPFKDMKVGDSFLVKNDDPMLKKLRRCLIEFCNKNIGYKFKTRICPEGRRVWCVSIPVIPVTQEVNSSHQNLDVYF